MMIANWKMDLPLLHKTHRPVSPPSVEATIDNNKQEKERLDECAPPKRKLSCPCFESYGNFSNSTKLDS